QHVRLMLRAVVHGRDDVRQIPGAIRRERLKWKDFRLGRDEMDQAGGHRAVAERGVRSAVKNRRRRLIQNRGAGLLHDHWLGPPIGIAESAQQVRYVEPLRCPWLVAREVVSRKQYGSKNGMVGVHARVNHRDDSLAGSIEALLGVLQTDDRGSR